MNEVENRQYKEYLLSDDWKAIAQQRRIIDNGICQMCGSRGTRMNPVQVHHLSYKNIYREMVYSDLVCVCRSCHIGVHNLMNRVTNANGRHGWRDCSWIPQVYTFTLDGLEMDRKEEVICRT